MQIQSSAKSIKPKIPKQNEPKKNAEPKHYKPSVEWWEHRGEKFETTEALVDAMPPNGKRMRVTYHFKEDPGLGRSNATTNQVVGGLAGAAIGAGTIFGGAAVLNALDGLASAFDPYSSGNPLGVSTLVALGAAAIGAAVGVGLTRDIDHQRRTQGRVIPGTVQKFQDGEQTKTHFYPGNSNKPVDLEKHAQAETPPTPEKVELAPVTDMLAGGFIGALGLANWPLWMIAPVPTAVVGSGIAQSAFGDEVSAGVLGMTAPIAAFGIPAAAGAVAAGAGFSTAGIIATGAASLPIAGAIMGGLLGPRIRHNMAEQEVVKDQWWSRTSTGA